MDKSKLMAIIALLVGGGAVFYSQNSSAPKAPASEEHSEGDGHDHSPKAAAAPDFDVVGGVTKLKIEDVKIGTGAVAKAGDIVSVNYRGTLLNGKQFDESYSKGPFEFPLGAGRVIKGWDEGVAGMKVGGKRKLTIPGALAYGKAGAGADIPPNATLKFDVDLLGIKGK